MPPASKQSRTQGRWRAIALSLFVHGLIVAAAVLGWFTWKHEPPEPETLAVQGTMVDPRELKGIDKLPEVKPEPPAEPPAPEPEPEAQPPPPEEQGPPAPDPEELKRKEEERLAAEKAEAEKAEQQKQEQEQLARERQQKEEQQRLDAEKEAAAKKEAEKQAAAKAAAKLNEERAAAEKLAAEKRAAEKKKAEDAAAARKAAEEKARKASEEELRRSLEAEERGNAARNSDEANRWHNSIVAKIQRAWIRPPSAVPGVTCIVLVNQVAGGEVTSVRVDSCSVNDAALRDSVEAAVLRASPLPTPPPGVPFERNLELTFAPQ